ncbi:hypothetical protein DPMN_093894 [Dreissena polymorpha]|uniref:Uncharacterized protein n=1 Tax=Dreissena polymorpha TaxID=45954 RepID=A0A9D4R261_DREPO|nr:hypothetical protein DPMN_093894 [Dreissena polymorpha]
MTITGINNGSSIDNFVTDDNYDNDDFIIVNDIRAAPGAKPVRSQVTISASDDDFSRASDFVGWENTGSKRRYSVPITAWEIMTTAVLKCKFLCLSGSSRTW